VCREVYPVFHRILVLIDGSESSLQAARTALETAALWQAELHLLSIEVIPSDEGGAPTVNGHQHPSSAAYFNQLQAPIRQWAERQGVLTRSVIRSGPHESQIILDYSKEAHCDLIILGATGNISPWQTMISETARHVAHSATCTVLLVRSSASRRLVRDVMTMDIPSVTQQAPLSEIVSYLIEGGVKLLPVVSSERRVVGVITLGHLFTHDDVFRRLDLRQAAGTESLGQYVHQLFVTKKTAREVMHKHPLVLKDDMVLSTAAQRMISHHVTRAPVVNVEEVYIGVLDQAQILRAYTEFSDEGDKGPGAEELSTVLHPQTVGDAVLSHVPLLPIGTPLLETFRRVQETPLRRVIVVDHDGKAVGVIADSDILAARGLAARRNPIVALAGRFSLHISEEALRRRSTSGPLTAQEVMRPRLFAVTPTTSIAEALRLMLEHHIKRLVVVDGAGKPQGLVDRQQLLRSLLGGDLLP
jgi:CBS domain-containing protein